ncbi:MAG: hypothetical protein MUE54_01875 [Anaerolineae bacterium]|nr:hypothetical protein [Anaerolineae bacterium]
MATLIFIFLLLFGGCVGLSDMDILPVYPDGPAPTAIMITPPIIEATPTPTLNFDNPTPTPFPTPQAENVPCVITVRQPPVTAPTRIPDPMNPNAVGGQIDTHLAYCVTSTTPKVGETFQIYVRAIDLGMPSYNFIISNIKGETLALSYNPAVPSDYTFESNLNAITILSAVTRNSWEVVITLVANSADALSVTGSASGEVHFGYPGPAMWTSATLDPFEIVISE